MDCLSAGQGCRPVLRTLCSKSDIEEDGECFERNTYRMNVKLYAELPLKSIQKLQQLQNVWTKVSDPAMKQFLLYLDESNALGKKFIIQDLDETHVFVLAEMVNFLQERVGELMDQNSFPITQK